MKTLRKHLLASISIVLVLSILVATGIAFALPPSPKKLKTNVHWAQANNDNGNLVSAFSPQNFTVKAGTLVELIVSNNDQVAPEDPHEANEHPIQVRYANNTEIGVLHTHPGETDSIVFVVDQDVIFRCVNRDCAAHRYMTTFFGTNGNIMAIP